ncbi:MAG: 30S ribosomal protein S6 [Sedimentisphaerales bacterium]|nr:30S ribosomal protein S6 [Sedimentisphaerales bacterium]
MLSSSLEQTYEAMFLVDSAEATANWSEIITVINTVMERAEAEVISLRKWDERRLTFEIAGRKRGTYILCYFKSAPSAISGIERDVQLNESLLRVLILRADPITEEAMQSPTPAMVKESAERKAAEETQRKAEEQARRKAEKAAEESGKEQSQNADETATAVAEKPAEPEPDESAVSPEPVSEEAQAEDKAIDAQAVTEEPVTDENDTEENKE